MDPINLLAIELLYLLGILGFCLFIYFKTKEVYDLTRLSGIFFFRNTFLFFAVAYFLRLVHIFVLLFIDRPDNIFQLQLSMFLVSFFSTMAILSLVATVFSRKIENNHEILNMLIGGIALVGSYVSFVTRSAELMIIIPTLIFIVTLVLVFVKRSDNAITTNKITYLLLFLFWITNIFAYTLVLFPLFVRVLVYIANIVVFVSIYVRVSKRLPDGKEKKQD